MTRAPISAAVVFGLACCVATAGLAQSKAAYRPARHAGRADHSALPYQVHIEPTKMKADSTSIEVGGDSWTARGYDLKALIAEVYSIDARRIEIPSGMNADARFDVSLDLPVEVDAATMQQILGDAIQKRFNVKIAAESRPMDVYVLTAPNGTAPALHRHAPSRQPGVASLVSQESGDDGGQITYFGKDCSGVSSGGISVTGSTLSDFRRTLEPDLDRVLLDETQLSGNFDFKVGNYSNQDELFKLLHDELGLVVTPAQRSVTVLAVRPADATAPSMLQAKL